MQAPLRHQAVAWHGVLTASVAWGAAWVSTASCLVLGAGGRAAVSPSASPQHHPSPAPPPPLPPHKQRRHVHCSSCRGWGGGEGGCK